MLAHNNKFNGRLYAFPLNDSLDASLIQISEGISQGFRDCQFPSQHPIQANINDSHEVIERFVWNSMSGF